MMQVYIGIGSNQNAATNIARALELLRHTFGPVQQAPLYRTPAVGFSGPDFLNGALCLETGLSIAQVREQCQQIERRVGRYRERERGCGSRCIDLDLLLFRQQGQDLQPPHPDLFNQGYSAVPFCDLYPDWTHPELGEGCYADFVRSKGWQTQFEKWADTAGSEVSARRSQAIA